MTESIANYRNTLSGLRLRIWLVAGVAVAMLFLLTLGAAVAVAAPVGRSLITDGLDADGRLTLIAGKSAVLTSRVPCKRVSIGQPDIADVTVVAPTTFLLTAKKQGVTQLIIWDDADRAQTVDVAIQLDVQFLQQQLQRMFAPAAIELINANGTLALRGQVPSIQVAEQAVQLATPYAAGGKVLNFLEVSGGQQVLLEVRFAEVSRTAINALGVNLGLTDGHSFLGSNIGQISPLGVQNNALNVNSPNPAVTLFGHGEVGTAAFSYFIEALRENDLMRVLAEPNLIASSGQEASFLAGGEFPVPVPQSGTGSGASTITIEYKQFGVRLRFVPVVLGQGAIRLKVEPEVSDLDYTKSVSVGGLPVPSLRTRRVSTTVELHEGQSFAIAGLMDHNTFSRSEVTPLLGDLPVLGALFRSVRYERRETELVVLVTPRLVQGMNPGQVPVLPGEKWRHPTEAELFWNRDLGGTPAPTTRPSEQQRPAPRFQGEYGFLPAGGTN